MGLTKTLSLGSGEDDVTVNAIRLGIVDTPMWRDVLTPASEESYEETIQRSILFHRDQKSEDMGRPAVFLSKNRNITGRPSKLTAVSPKTCSDVEAIHCSTAVSRRKPHRLGGSVRPTHAK